MIGVRSRGALLAAISTSIFAAAVSVPAQAQQMYRWTDEKGGVHITDTPPPASAKSVQKQKPAAVPVDGSRQPFELAQAMKDFPVTLYTAPNCGDPCQQARATLNRRGVPFKEIQVWEPETGEELKKLTGGTLDVPVLTVGRSVQRGFQQDAYDSLLDSARYPQVGILPARNQAAPKPPGDYLPPGERGTSQAEPAKPAAEEPRPAGPYAPRFSK